MDAPFIIYNASAGSGKTFTLVKNYLSDLLRSKSQHPYRNILAITFTNKAVAEMKTRILESLEAFSNPPISRKYQALFEEVREETQLPPAIIQQKAQQLLQEILYDYAAFEVSTIDSFTNRIIRTFARDLELPANFKIQLETEEILEEATNRVLEKTGKVPLLTRALINFALAKTDDDKSWDISRDLNKIAKVLTQEEDNFPYIQKLRSLDLQDFMAFGKELRINIQKTKEERQNLGKTFLELTNKNQLDINDFKGKSRSVYGFFQKIAQGKNTKPSSAKWTNFDGEPLYKKDLAENKKTILDRLKSQIAQLYEKATRLYYQRKFFLAIAQNNNSLSLIVAIEKELDQLKKERNFLPIYEFNKRISDTIKGQPAPFIYERLGERFQNFYIDEFQDTSVLQWKNLIPLAGDSLASGKGKVTLVGDTKQSIYRWRGGKAEQFMALSMQEEGVNPFFVRKEIIRLENNFRSLQNIVQFNNDFFTHAAQFLSYEPYRKLFEAAVQVPKKGPGGYVQIEFIAAKKKEEEDEIYPVKVLEIIKDLREKNYNLRDICVLVRKNEEAEHIGARLGEHKIPFISSKSLLIQNAPEVLFIINLLKYSQNYSDKNLKFELLHYLYNTEKIEQNSFQFISSKLHFEGQDLFDNLKPIEREFNLKELHSLPLYDAVEYIIQKFKIISSNDLYLEFFLEFVYNYTQDYSGGIPGFIEKWELKKDKLWITIPEGSNAVRILTVHQAKGLEFPIVIHPYANQKLTDLSKQEIWVDLGDSSKIPLALIKNLSKELPLYSDDSRKKYEETLHAVEMDTMNVFYVALTRAEEQLYILSKADLNKKKEHNTEQLSGILIDFLKEKGIWKEEQWVYSLGDKPQSQEKKEEEIPMEIATESYTSHHIPQFITKSAQLWDTPQNQAIEEGNLIHNLLKDIYTHADIPKVLEQALLNGEIPTEKKEQYQKTLQNIVNKVELKPYFSEGYKIYTEKEILFSQQFKRLDRLCICGDSAIIIDYKTGNPEPRHKAQIRSYAEAIKKMGYEVKQQLLVYIDKTQPVVQSVL